MVIKDALKVARNMLLESNLKSKETLSNQFVGEYNIDPREARLLLAYSMGILPDDLIKYKECSDEQYDSFISNITRRINGEPYAYIVGYKEFMKLKFNVNKYVLIPREDTEILVQEAINLNRSNILDMCTGSGCIAISLYKYLHDDCFSKNSNKGVEPTQNYINDIIVDAVDISQEALEVARSNALMHNAKVNFIQSNLFEKITSKYDLIVCNPPYIKTEDIEKLQIEVKNEPVIALDGGLDGLDFYRKISKQAVEFLNEKGILMFEIGFDEAENVCKILKKDDYINTRVIKDLSLKDRVIIAEKR